MSSKEKLIFLLLVFCTFIQSTCYIFPQKVHATFFLKSLFIILTVFSHIKQTLFVLSLIPPGSVNLSSMLWVCHFSSLERLTHEMLRRHPGSLYEGK